MDSRKTNSVVITKEWCMPDSNTFRMKPVIKILEKYIQKEKHREQELIIIDPFSRNSNWGTITNDLNPDTKAKYHMDASKFLDMLIENNTKADVVLFDPPYSTRQISECYQSVGMKATYKDTGAFFWSNLKKKLSVILKTNGIAISFGWNSSGLGKSNGMNTLEIMLLCHGGAHNDTIITVEKKDGIPTEKTEKRIKTCEVPIIRMGTLTEEDCGPNGEEYTEDYTTTTTNNNNSDKNNKRKRQ